MRLLAIETSTREAGIALFDDNHLLAQTELPANEGTAKVLAPTISQQLTLAGWKPQDIQLIAVSQGPGSFTGLRVGITTAKTMAYALGTNVLGVNSLEVIAWQVPTAHAEFWVAIDAQRQQVLAGRFHRGDNPLDTLGPATILDNQQWIDQLSGGAVVTGPALRKLRDKLPAAVTVVDSAHWLPTAPTVGQLAFRHFQLGRRDDLWKLVPHYYRKSAAEEKVSG